MKLNTQQILEKFSQSVLSNSSDRELAERNLKIFQLRVLNDMTLKSVGDEFGLSQERTRQIVAKVVRKFKYFLAKKDLTF